jgi:hypothetical protein
VSAHQQDRPGQPDPAGPADVWGVDELDKVLADPRDAGRLGQILAAAGAPAEAMLLPGEDVARSAFRAAFPVPTARKPRVLARMSGRAAAVALCGGLVLTAGAAAAAVGALPDPAQQTAKGVLAKLGVNIPGPHEHATLGLGVHHPRSGKGIHQPVATAEPTATPRDEPSSIGSEVSALARTTTLTGVDKGVAVSGLASDGKSQAGLHGKPASSPTEKAKKSPKPQASKPHNGKHQYTPKDKPKTHAAAPVPDPNGAGNSSSTAERP